MTHYPPIKLGQHGTTEAETLVIREALELYYKVQAGQLSELTTYIRQAGDTPETAEACRLVCEAGNALHPGRAQRPAAEVPEAGLIASSLVCLIDRDTSGHARLQQAVAARSRARFEASR